MKPRYKILITSAGESSSTGVIHSLKQSKYKFDFIGVDANKYTIHRSEANINYLIPLAKDKSYLVVMQLIIDKHKPDLLHCQNSSEILWISAYRNKLNINTFLPSHESIKICSDKFLSYKIWEKNNVPTPNTMLIRNLEDLIKAFKKYNKVWIRAISGSAGNGSLSTNDRYLAEEWIDSLDGWGKFTAAEHLTKDTTTWLSIWKDGELIVGQGRKRHYWEFGNRTQSGVIGITGLDSTVSDPILDDIAIRAIKAIDNKPNGIWGVDLTYDKKGIPNVTEINIGRFFTTVHFFTLAGCNFPEMYFKCAMDIPIYNTPIINPCKEGLYYIRGIDFLPKIIYPNEIKRYDFI